MIWGQTVGRTGNSHLAILGAIGAGVASHPHAIGHMIAIPPFAGDLIRFAFSRQSRFSPEFIRAQTGRFTVERFRREMLDLVNQKMAAVRSWKPLDLPVEVGVANDTPLR